MGTVTQPVISAFQSRASLGYTHSKFWASLCNVVRTVLKHKTTQNKIPLTLLGIMDEYLCSLGNNARNFY
jgi:hypothetical protein